MGKVAERSPIPLFSDGEDYQHSLTLIPKSSVSRPLGSILDAHFNYALGAQFNTPVSLSAIVCDQAAARAEMTSSISNILEGRGYKLGVGWDKFGFLNATKNTDREIELANSTFQEIELHVKIDQTELGERAITFWYQVLTYIRKSDPGTREDRSSDKPVDLYMADLRGEMRRSIEAALQTKCTRHLVREFTTPEEGIDKMGGNLTPTQQKELRSTLKRQSNDK